MSELPEGWAHACISDLADINPKQDFDDHLPAGFVPMSHAPTNFRDKLRFDERNWGEIKKAYTTFKDGDVIFAKVTPCFENGKAALVEGLPNGIGAGSSEFFVLRPSSEGVSAKYLLALIKSREFMLEGAANMTGAVGLRRVPRQFVGGFALPVPPAAEQTRIAQKLDELLAQVDTLKARIDAIPTLLKRFRQSVLATAVSGRLTEAWRAQSGQPNEISNCKLETIARFIDYRGKTPTKVESGIPLITAKNIRKGYISREPREYIRPEDYDSWMTRGIPNVGDVLITTEAPLGNVATIDIHEKFALAQRAICLQFTEEINSKFAAIELQSPQFQEKLLEKATGTTVKGIKASVLKKMDIACPSLAEQTEIVRRVEQLFAFADQLEAKVASAKSRIDHLTQSILAKAFRGELVPQDPNDEPASVLLERIQAQRAATPKAKRGRKASV
ncbi:restriction endonuclease subunit S [Pseudomonas sp. G34]|uniref:restriction endonuclease subunit S n=1 Tax=Pseudomonas sp. G34 TaxID=3059083 RepID=UPI002807BE88|nr:restriction endonuclease subunit S [Pseudomonas sp. G34]MDQ7986238.1 restriction endonuclease subunit S [Pseudomonas sp. G34]